MLKKLYRLFATHLGETLLFSGVYKILKFYQIAIVLRLRFSKPLKKGAECISRNNAHGPLVVIPLLETSHYQHYHVLAMAKAFSLRGYEVLVIICDEYLSACELKSIRNKKSSTQCFSCSLNRNYILDLFNLNCITLSEILRDVSDINMQAQKIIKKYEIRQEYLDLVIDDSVTRYFYGAERTIKSSIVDDVRAEHRKTAFISLCLGEELLKRFRPSICFNNMDVYSSWAPCFKLLKLQGVAPIVMSMCDKDLHAIRLNYADDFRNNRAYDRFLNGRGESPLTNHENKLLDNILSNRRDGKDDLMVDWAYFNENQNVPLSIDKNRKNVFVFPNIPWDAGLDEFVGPFAGVLDWIEQTINHYAGHKQIDIWIKPHPGEVRGTVPSGMSVSNFIKIKYPNLPKNIHVIDAELGVSPYSLFPYIDLGVVLTGTLALEMAAENIPVVTAGVSPCHGLGFLSEPASPSEYFDCIEFGENLANMKAEFRLFCYFYFINRSMKWPLTKRCWADDLSGFQFDNVNELGKGEIEKLDEIFEEIQFLVNDFQTTN